MRYLLFFLSVMLMCLTVSAVPTTSAATMIGNNNVTFTATGVTGTAGWFNYGSQPGASWNHLPNVTPSGGSITYVWSGLPIWGNTKYYFKACDSTGCGSELSFTTLTVTPIPTGTWGDIAANITENRFTPMNVMWNSIQAYARPETGGLIIFYALIFAGVFVAMWLRVRGTQTASIFGMIMIGLTIGTTGLLVVGLPPEFVAVGQALLIISLTGTVIAWTFK
jgi:hypothetical protein